MTEGDNKVKDDINKIYDEQVKHWLNKFAKDIDTNFSGKAIRSIMNDVSDAATKVIQTFGSGRERMLDLKSTMADAVTSVRELGGDLSDIQDAQVDVSQALKRNLILTSDSFKELYAVSKVTGKDVSTLVTNFKDVGISAYQLGEKVNEALAISQKLGVNGKEVVGAMMSNMESLNKFNFEGGTEGLAKMAAHAASLRFNMRETLNVADKVFNPEGAIQVAAAMQRLGVAQSDLLDPLKLMDLSQNDPAELQKQLEQMSKSFVKMKKDGTFEILPGEKRRLQEIENQLGMSQGSLAKLALSSGEVSEKMKRIRFGGNFTEEEQRFIASISEIGKGGDMRIRLDGENLGIGDALQKFRQDPEKLKELMKPKDAIQLAQDQLTNLQQINASSKAMADRSGLALAGTRGATEIEEGQRKLLAMIPKFTQAPGLTTESIRKDFFGSFDKIMDDVLAGKSGTETMTNFIKNMQNYEKEFAKIPDHLVKTAQSFDAGSNRFLILGDKIFGLTEALEKANFSGLGEKMDNLVKNSIPVPDAIVIKRPADSVKETQFGSLIGTNLGGGNVGGATVQSTNSQNTITVELKVDDSGSKNFTTEQLKLALNDSAIVKAVEEAVRNAQNNFGRSGKTTPLQSNLPNARGN